MTSNQSQDAWSLKVECSSAQSNDQVAPQATSAPAGFGTVTKSQLDELERQPLQQAVSVSELRGEKLVQLSRTFDGLGAEIPPWMTAKMADHAVKDTYNGNLSHHPK